MRCPCCGKTDKIITLASRRVKPDNSIRRRRECRRCLLRWSTKESILTETLCATDQTPETDEPHCHRCEQWQSRTRSCGLGFPESRLSGFFAAECLHYQAEPQVPLAA